MRGWSASGRVRRFRRMGGAKRYPSMPPFTWVGDGFRCALPILRTCAPSTSLRAKRSNPSISVLSHGLLRCARNDVDTVSPSRGAQRPSCACRFALKSRGRRECRAPAGTRGLVCNVHEEVRTRAYRYSRSTPAFPAQGSVWGQKVELIQRGASVVFAFMSRSAIDLAAERNMGTC